MYKYIRYSYLIVSGTIYDIEMIGIVLLSLLNASICIFVLKEHLHSLFLLGVAINYIGIFILGGKITIARIKQIDLE